MTPQDAPNPNPTALPPTRPESVLLCERCGYDLSAAEHGTPVCPECGEPIEASLPERRFGSAWQRRPGLTSWIFTCYRVLRHPRRSFRTLRIDRAGVLPLLAINCFIASFFIADPWVGVLAGDPVRAAHGSNLELLARVLGYLAYTASITLLLMALSAIEVRGVLFFGQRRGWWLSPAAAWQVCAHASVGWIFCGVLSLLGMATLTALSLRTNIIPKRTIDLSPMFAARVHWHDAIGAVLFVGGHLLGMLIFETMVYLGVRECRYANAPGASVLDAGTRPSANPKPAPQHPTAGA